MATTEDYTDDNAGQYKEHRELLYDKANKLYQMAVRGEENERQAFKIKYDEFMRKHSLDERIVIDVQKFKELKPNKTFKFDGMEFLTFAEFQNWFELNKDTMSFLQRIKLMRAAIFKK